MLADGTRVDYGMATRLGTFHRDRVAGHAGGRGGFTSVLESSSRRRPVDFCGHRTRRFAISPAASRGVPNLSRPLIGARWQRHSSSCWLPSRYLSTSLSHGITSVNSMSSTHELTVLIAIPVLVALRLAPSQPAVPTALPSNDDIRKILVNRIGTEQRGVGIVVGVIDGAGRRVISYGGTDSGAGRNVDGNTVFEIGSATKVFTSNLGAGLLGHALSRRAGMDYESQVRTGVTEPLGMTSTAIMLSDALKARHAPGHGATGARVANWDIPTLAGAGALRSTADDLLKLLAAELRYAPSPLAAAMDAMLKVRRPTGTPGLEIALGRHVRVRASGGDIVWHNGGPGGYRSIIAFNQVARTGVIVLSNMNTDSGVDDLGQHILDPSVPLTSAPVERKEVAVAADYVQGR